MGFVNVFDSFSPVILLNVIRFKSSVLCETHTLLDKLFTVLQLPIYMFNLMANCW